MRILIAIITLLLLTTVAYATEVVVEYGWNGPEVTEMRLYANAEPIATFPYTDTQTWSGDVTIPEGRTIFTLSAVFTDGSESQQSDEYYFYVIEHRPVLIRIE